MGKVTIEAWIYWEETNGNEVDFVTAKGFEQFEIHTGGGAGYNGLRFIPKTGLWLDTRQNVIEPNKWYHIAFCYDPNSTGAHKTCYINGKYENLNVANGDTSSAIQTSVANFLIGNRNAASYYFKGKIDEVRIWNTIRSQDEIKTNMYKELTGDETGLVAYYKMSNGTGTTLTDNQTSGTNTGTLTNGPVWVASGCFAGSRNTLTFDGTDDYVDFTNDPPYNNSAITLEAWIKSTSSLTEREIFSWSDPNAIEFRMNEGKLQFGISTGDWDAITSETNINTGNWTHVAAVKDGSTINLYINGIKDKTGIINLTPTGNVFRISDFYNGGRSYFFPEQIDEVRIWNTARTESQIRENMMKNLVGNEPGLVAYYRFDEYSGTTLYDLTNNGYNGTLTNMGATPTWATSTAFNTWIGGESNNWATAANWSNGVPSATDNVGLYKWDLNSITTYDVLNNSDFTTNSLFISSTSNPTLPTTFTVNGSFVIEKNIDITGKTITLGSSGYLSEGNYRLYGTSGTISTTRTLGTLATSTNVGGLGLEIKSTSDLGNTTITRGMATQSTGGLSNPISRYYDVTSVGGGTRDIVFHYNEAEMTGSESSLSLFNSTNSGTNWSLLSNNRNTTNNTVSVTGLNSFSIFTLADEGSPLPVELQSLSATIKNNKVLITWQTATEINNYGFEIERAQVVEGKTGEYNKIGFVQGHGNSNTIIDYTFTDAEVKYGKYSYRLKQIDNDGKYNYSKSIEAEINNITNYSLSQNYPNPFNPSTTISYEIPKTTNVSIKVYNILGKEIATLVNEKQETGIYKVEFNGSNLSSGIYYYKLETEGFSQVKKMTLIK